MCGYFFNTFAMNENHDFGEWENGEYVGAKTIAKVCKH